MRKWEENKNETKKYKPLTSLNDLTTPVVLKASRFIRKLDFVIFKNDRPSILREIIVVICFRF
jgi:hypothetical protein